MTAMASADASLPVAHLRDGEDRVLPDGMPLDYILDVEEWCNGFLREEGEPTVAHADPNDYLLDDLVAMYEHCDCPLHMHPDYPFAPAGVWTQHVNAAGDRLDRLTEKHTGRYIGENENNYEWSATPAELRELWDEYPHARWLIERWAMNGDATIHVVDE